MKFVIAVRETDFYENKADTASKLDSLPPDQLFQDLEDDLSDSDWVHVARFFQGITGAKGWVERINVVEATDDQIPRAELSADTFVAECVARAWTTNRLDGVAPFYVDRDYLIALALIQSGMTNPVGAGPKGTRVGPFGITEQEWKAFMAASFNGYQYKDYELQLPLFQVAGAAYQMRTDAKELSALWQTAKVGTKDDPYLPRLGELLRCRLIGVKPTFEMQVKLKNNEGSQMLPDFLEEQGLSKQRANELMTDRRRFMRTGESETGDPVSLQVFNDKCTEVLNAVLKEAFELISKHVPEAVEPIAGSAPWMKFAQQELDAKISENTAAGRKKIAQYFKSTGFKQGTADDKWCAAFVSWCMDQCAKSISKSFDSFRNEAAAAKSWREWGIEVSPGGVVPPGAVVLLSPSKNTDAISHVGFFVEFHDDRRKVEILGGNQSNEVNKTNFNAADVIGLRWLESEAHAGAAAVAAATDHEKLFVSKAPDIMAKLIADFILNEIQAAGILGNIGHECDGFHAFQEINPIGGGRGGLGWAQWTGSRRVDFENWCATNNLKTSSDEGNYGFLKHELESSERSAISAVKGAATLKDAVRVFEAKFERAGVKHYDRRDNWAALALAAFRSS